MAADAARSVAWATGQRESGLLEGFTLAPVTLEDAYLALTTTAAADEDHDPAPAEPDEETVHV